MASAAAPADDPVLVWGAGAIGGTMAAYWARAGIPVLVVDVVREHVEACRTTGLAIEGPLDAFRVTVPALPGCVTWGATCPKRFRAAKGSKNVRGTARRPPNGVRS